MSDYSDDDDSPVLSDNDEHSDNDATEVPECEHYRLGKISSPIFLPQETSTCFIQFFGFSRHLGLI